MRAGKKQLISEYVGYLKVSASLYSSVAPSKYKQTKGYLKIFQTVFR
ncbi:hypothetical protein NEIELOOT_01928 [Neisseria elongata subsp. glycolytica ATCC 29315]|uniref:Uncharacterized protein n=1 Tax=Neisseria elongata subsp. glycolytica ATCC 29315 TaxID=546263 RepID=D4DS84_NEIEG|nr:hypothetical protein NEIELOOT_01928 [Neisseria elongata subsp. glycolytica ATCC 29315]